MIKAHMISKIRMLLIFAVLVVFALSATTLGAICANNSKGNGQKTDQIINHEKGGSKNKKDESKNRKGESKNIKDAQSKKKGDLTGWLVSQNTPVNPYATSQIATVYGGIADVRAGPFEIIVDSDNQTITFVSHKSRLYYQGPFDEWKKRYYPESIKTGRKFLLDDKPSKKMFGIVAHRSFFSQKEPDGTIHKLREVWWTDDIKIAGAGGEYVWICSGLPVHPGVPLSIIRMLPNGKKDPVLTTVDIKKSNIVLSSFVPLPEYKRVKSEFQLQVGQSEDLNELLGGE